MYFKGAEAALVVYDMTEENSFEKANKWVKDLEEALEFEEVKAFTYLVDNKSDMTDDQ
jgi:GTPase SAR1 family protein